MWRLTDVSNGPQTTTDPRAGMEREPHHDRAIGATAMAIDLRAV